ncbi:MAG TPA: hypothetical protein VKV40_08830 [Ktedonobacteraceae bacterium]|nr:hypothetical protein [Ktedonobacteraceae bacterium]
MARGKSRSHDVYGYDDAYDDDYDEYEDERYRRPRTRASARRRPRRRRRTWPILLLGCLGGILLVVVAIAVLIFVAVNRTVGTMPLPGGIPGSVPVPGIGGNNPSTFTKTDVQLLPIPGGTIAQVQVHNQIGNITLNTDPSAQQVTVTALKTVKAASQSVAQPDFNHMQVQSAFDQTTKTLTVSASVPNSSGSLLGSHNDTIDLTIVLPASSPDNGNSPVPLDIETSVGNIQVTGLNGVMTVKDDIGNVTVQGQLFDGSHLETGTGNVTFNGSLDTTLNPQANYKFQCEVGNLNVTLPATTNVTLDANTNVGNIKSAFPINVQSSDGSASYYGPLLPNASPAPTVTLVLDVSSGNIGLQKD